MSGALRSLNTELDPRQRGSSLVGLRPGQKMRRLIISSQSIEGDLDLRGVSVTESIRLFDLRVHGDLLLDEARALGGLDIRSLTVDGRISLDSARVFGMLRLEELRGRLSMLGAQVEGEAHFRRLQLDSLRAEGALLRGGLELEQVCVRGALDFSELELAGWFDCSGLDAARLVLSRARLGSGFECRNGVIRGDLLAEDLRIAGDASLRGSRIESVLRAPRSSWAGRLDMVRLKAGSLELQGARFQGPVQLDEAQLEALDLREVEMPSLELNAAQVGGKLNLSHARIFGALQGRGLLLAGEGLFLKARIERVGLTEGRFGGDLRCHALTCQFLDLSHARVEGDLSFAEAALQELDLQEALIERRCELRGLELRAMRLRGARVALPSLRWGEMSQALGRDPAVISENAAVVEEWLSSSRRFDELDEALFIRLENERRARALGSWRGSLSAGFEWALIALPTGYGLRPGRVLGSMAFVVLALTLAQLSLNVELWRQGDGSHWRVLTLASREALSMLMGGESLKQGIERLSWLSDLGRVSLWLLSALFVGTLTRRLTR